MNRIILAEALTTLYPKAKYHIKNDDVVWEDQKVSLDMEKVENEMKRISLNNSINTKTISINTSCEKAIVSGFPSSALGSEHFYQSDRDDQINLMGLVTDGVDDNLKCGVKDGDGNIAWNWKPHTIDQLKKVFSDGKAYKTQQLIKATQLKAQINKATTVEGLDGISW